MSPAEARQAIAEALDRLQVEIPGIQVSAYALSNPTLPSIDVYPGDPFYVGAGFGVGEIEAKFTVRARVSTADDVAGQMLMDRLLDPGDPASVEAALAVDTAWIKNDDVVSGYRVFPADASGNSYAGCTWGVTMFL